MKGVAFFYWTSVVEKAWPFSTIFFPLAKPGVTHFLSNTVTIKMAWPTYTLLV